MTLMSDMEQMNPKTSSARDLLRAEGYTCVFYGEHDLITERTRGVTPLLSLLDGGQSLGGFCAADKVVGKAAAFLYVLLSVDELFAEVISEPAKEVLSQYHIPYFAEKTVSAIRNRSGDGYCPMESSVLDIQTPDEALTAIRKTLQALRARQS